MERKCIEGGFRKIDAMAVFENLVATAESQSIRWGVQINKGKGENQKQAGGRGVAWGEADM
jgi:hypothetical protein